MSNPSPGDDAGSTGASPTGPSPNSIKPSPKLSTNSSSSAAAPVAPATSGGQSQFHRFRLSGFDRTDSSPTSASPAGHCSRFRVTDFVPWPSQADPPLPHPPPPPPPHPHLPGITAMNGGRPLSDGSPSSATTPRAGSFSVMHMDVDGPGPQQTSSSVAAAAGSTRGVLQKITVPSSQTQGLKQAIPIHPRPLAPSPITPNGMVPYNPATVPQEAVWELSRILNILRNTPPEMVVRVITDALISWPSVLEGSLLRRIGEIFPQLPTPSPGAAMPGPSNGVPSPSPQEPPPRRKRGRPPGKKTKLNDGSSATVAIAANLAAMPPPPLPFVVPGPQAQLAPAAPPPPTTSTSTKRNQADAGKLLLCTRCLKHFNPTWRATPASDPSSEATCAVKHPFKDFPSGLEVVAPARRKNNYKTTWKWRCCGREVQSTSDELLLWPRKEDDRTGGWCFVGKHTTEQGVREKLGLKPGKGKRIHGDGEKKHKNGEHHTGDHSQANGAQEDPKGDGSWGMSSGSGGGSHPEMPGPANSPLQQYSNHPQQPQQLQPPPPQDQQPPYQQPAYQHQHQADTSPNPPTTQKRKRGRPKGSKTRSKAMPVPATPASKALPQQSDPASQLIAEQGHQEQQDQTSFWTQYSDPNTAGRTPSSTGTGSGASPLEDPAISTADLSLLASATAAMAGAGTGKRKRGRPRGSKNANGKGTAETAQKPRKGAAGKKAVQQAPEVVEEEQAVEQDEDDEVGVVEADAAEDHSQDQDEEEFVGVGVGVGVGMGMPGMDGYPVLGAGDGGGWFG